MTVPGPDSGHAAAWREWRWIAGAMALTLVLLGFRNAGLLPSVFWDEWVFSRAARHQPVAAAEIPVYLYLALYRLSNYCGAGFLDCARILNSLFFVAASPFIFMVGRRVVAPATAAAIAVLALFAPLNSYAVYFMPESMYYFGFWMLTWFATGFPKARPAIVAGIAGVAIAVLSMVKVHAIFLLPALAVLVWMRACQAHAGAALIERPLAVIALLMASALLSRWGAGFAVAGAQGLDILGGAYGSHAGSVAQGADHQALVGLAATNLGGHLAVIAMLFGVPAAALLAPRDAVALTGQVLAGRWLRVFCGCVLVTLLVVTALFTASVVQVYEFESATRLHARYYNFAFPLLYLVVAAEAGAAPAAPAGRPLAFCIAGIIGALAIYAFLHPPPALMASASQYPEYRGVVGGGVLLPVVSILGIFALATWAFDRRLGARVFLLLCLPTLLLGASVNLNRELRESSQAGIHERAGMFARANLGPKERATLAVLVADDPHGIVAANMLFVIDTPGAVSVNLPPGSVVGTDVVPPHAQWLLVVGERELEPMFDQIIRLNGFSLLHVRGRIDLDFASPLWPGMIASSDGLAPPSRLGTWSSGKLVRLRFTEPLPQRFALELRAAAFGPNVGAPFALQVGATRHEFRLAGAETMVKLDIDNPDRAAEIIITVPQPVSEAEQGVGPGRRKYGLRLVGLRVDDSAKK
jgi:phosphoglycerol transferase